MCDGCTCSSCELEVSAPKCEWRWQVAISNVGRELKHDIISKSAHVVPHTDWLKKKEKKGEKKGLDSFLSFWKEGSWWLLGMWSLYFD